MATPSATHDGLTGRRFAEALDMAKLERRDMAHLAGISPATVDRFIRFGDEPVRTTLPVLNAMQVAFLMNGVALTPDGPQRVAKQEAAA